MGQKLSKFVLKSGIVTLVTFFAIFNLLGEIKNMNNNVSQTTSKTAFRVTMVTILLVVTKPDTKYRE
ncbi:MAG: hypothetical protein WBN72_01135 [Nitrososphaeraceae archaeon]